MKVPLFDISRQDKPVAKKIEAAIKKVLREKKFIIGPEVAEFEKQIAAYCGAKYAVATNSGTDAIYLALKALGIGAGDAVITTPFSFFATAEAIINAGAECVFADIDPKTFCIDTSQLKQRLNALTRSRAHKHIKAILPVHLYGHACDMDPIMKIAKEHGLKVIEDCAQGIGTKYKGRQAGTIGEIGCFSTFPTKNLGGYGDGGFIITNDEKLYNDLRIQHKHGDASKYNHRLIGVNSRMDTLQAAILLVKLKDLNRCQRLRLQNAKLYDTVLGTTGNLDNSGPGPCRDQVHQNGRVTIPYTAPYSNHTYHQYTIRVKHRDKLMQYLRGKGIAATVHYPLPIHLQPPFRAMGYKEGDFPQAEQAAQDVLSLPIFPGLTKKEITYTAGSIKNLLDKP